MYKLQFDSEDEAQICLEIISEALEEAKRKLILDKAKKRIEANRRLIEIAERFEGAVEVDLDCWAGFIWPKYMDTNKALPKECKYYAIPKKK